MTVTEDGHGHDHVAAAIRYLLATGAASSVEPAPKKYPAFAWAVHIPGCIQLMTDVQMVTFAENVAIDAVPFEAV
jgi:hypothetical protein